MNPVHMTVNLWEKQKHTHLHPWAHCSPLSSLHHGRFSGWDSQTRRTCHMSWFQLYNQPTKGKKHKAIRAKFVESVTLQ